MINHLLKFPKLFQAYLIPLHLPVIRRVWSYIFNPPLQHLILGNVITFQALTIPMTNDKLV